MTRWENNLVSIITPAYRAEKYILQTIDSVKKQTWQQWEMLIVDDCSPDATCEVVEKAASEDVRIRLIRQPKNGGPADARNAAITIAKGRWIAFLDSDDMWLPNKLERQLEFHQKMNVEISYTEFRRISEDATNLGHLITVPDSLNYYQLLRNTAIVTSTVIIDRNRTGVFKMKKTYYDDFACWLQLLKHGGQAAGLHQDLLRYRIVGNSVSRNKSRSAKEVWNTYTIIEKIHPFLAAWYFVNYAARGWLKYRKF